MAKTIYSAGIEIVSGALKKINTKSDHATDENMLLATHRAAETTRRACERLYIRKVNSLPWNKHKTYVISQDVQTLRNNFKNGSKAVAERSQQLSTLTGDQQAFMAIKPEVEAMGKRITLKSFFWAAYKKYEGTFPQGAIQMTADEYAENSYADNSPRWW